MNIKPKSQGFNCRANYFVVDRTSTIYLACGSRETSQTSMAHSQSESSFFPAKKLIDRFEEETEKIRSEKERIVADINAFDLNTGEYLQIV